MRIKNQTNIAGWKMDPEMKMYFPLKMVDIPAIAMLINWSVPDVFFLRHVGGGKKPQIFLPQNPPGWNPLEGRNLKFWRFFWMLRLENVN